MRHRCAHALASLALSWAGAAAAEAAPTAQDAACRTEEATLQQEIDAARARGRMLQRRQLAERRTELARLLALPQRALTKQRLKHPL